MEELKTIPNEPSMSAPALAAKLQDEELNVASSGAASTAPLPVNDLTSVVKKKKKPVAPDVHSAHANGDTNEAGPTKRKAEDEGLHSPTDKKARVEDEQPATEAAGEAPAS